VRIASSAGSSPSPAAASDRAATAARPFTSAAISSASAVNRCVACNCLHAAVPKSEVEDSLQPGTRRSYQEFARCPGCGRVYWRGAHNRRLQRIVAAAQAVVTRDEDQAQGT